MKKLFEMRSAVIVEGDDHIRITGPYQLLAVQAQSATFTSKHFTIQMTGEDLFIQTLSEEVVEIAFSSIQSIHFEAGEANDPTKI